jgi:S1-C subfamily serine protease
VYGQYGGADDPPTVPLYLPPASVALSALPARIGIQMRNVSYSEPSVGWIYAVQVLQVEPGSPAARAGIEPGDVITRINGVRTFTYGDVQRLIGQAAGDVVVRLRDWRTHQYVDTQPITPIRSGSPSIKKEPKEENLD